MKIKRFILPIFIILVFCFGMNLRADECHFADPNGLNIANPWGVESSNITTASPTLIPCAGACPATAAGVAAKTPKRCLGYVVGCHASSGSVIGSTGAAEWVVCSEAYCSNPANCAADYYNHLATSKISIQNNRP